MPTMTITKSLIILFLVIMLGALGTLVAAQVLMQGGTAGGSGSIAIGQKVTVFESPTCGCCDNYISYLEDRGYEVKVVERADMASVKVRYGVPSSLESCHTSLVDEYVVEGHVPLEVIEEVLKEQPDIAGIALPGMPSGSPGMPGAKEGSFVIHKITAGGEDGGVYTEF